jgi:hypothetical protein
MTAADRGKLESDVARSEVDLLVKLIAKREPDSERLY